VDWAAWGGVVKGNQEDIEALAAAGVPGFKCCFLIHPGIDGFTMVGEEDLRTALPHVARTGLPLLVPPNSPVRWTRLRSVLPALTGDRTRLICNRGPTKQSLRLFG